MRNSIHTFVRLCGIAVAFLAALPVSADYNRMGIPDSSEIRRDINERWLSAPLSYIRGARPEIQVDSAGTAFQIRLEENDAEFAIVVAPQVVTELSVQENSFARSQMSVDYPAGAPGGWILYRSKETGKATKVRYYFCADSDVYIQFYPSGNRTLGDMVIFGFYAARGVPVGLPFASFYTASFEDVSRWTARTLPWEKTDIEPGLYANSTRLIAVIRSYLPHIRHVADSAYDENGNPVYVSTGKPRKELVDRDIFGNELPSDPQQVTVNGFGFLKWIADGLVRPLSGSGIKIAALTEPTNSYNPTGLQGNLERSYSLAAALDWTRNLSAQILSARTGRDYSNRNTGTDVTVNPFSAEIKDGRLINSAGYLQETGYQVDSLKAMLYVLAVTEPDTFYFGAIKERGAIAKEGAGTAADVLVFDRCAAFFPYFDSNARFRCAVFMDGRELSFEQFVSTFSGSFVHLSRIKSSDMFYPYK